MSKTELEKILKVAAKHVLDAGHLDKLEQAARKHARPFLSHQKVSRVHQPSEFLKRLQKAGGQS